MRTVADLLLARKGDTASGMKFGDLFVGWDAHVRRSAFLAGWLTETYGPRTHVGVLLGNVPDFSYLLGAAALGGHVLVGLNSTRRGAALQRDIAVSRCDVVVDSECVLPEGFAEPAVSVADPSELLMLIFTSGTSGEPKAVRCTHRKLVVPGEMLAERFGLGPSDTVYLSMPMFHSNAIMAGWAVALAAGSNIALREKFSASGFLDDVRRYGATYANYVGTPLSYVLSTPVRSDDVDNPLRVVYGNEAAPGAATEFARRFDVTVVDGFGSSEGGVSIARTAETPPAALGPLPAGVAVLDDSGNVCPAAVIDSHGRLLNADAIGELVNLDGPGMFEGYYEDPAADADRMRNGRYFTGDHAYVDSDGFVYFAGRSAGWMRVNGENLGAAPIERALLRHPDIEEVCVYGVTAVDGPGEQIFAAVVAPALDPSQFGVFLRQQQDLGPVQYPSYLRLCSELPRTASHKVIARALAAEGLGTSDAVWEASGETWVARGKSGAVDRVQRGSLHPIR